VRRRLATQVVFEPLERRLLLSSDPVTSLLPADWDGPHVVCVTTPARAEWEETNALAGTRELVIVDAAVADARMLVAQLTASAADRRFEVLRLDAGRDGIEQVSVALAQRCQIDAVHFVTHGGNGSLRLADTRLDGGTLDARASEIARWGDALKADGDLFLYGCDLAREASGRALVEALASLTRCDVAASADATGAAAAGGDWDLEHRVGDIAGRLALADDAGRWGGLLADIALASYAPGFAALADASHEIKSDQAWGQTFRVDSPGATYVVDAVELVLSRASDAPAQTLSVSIRESWNGPALASATIASGSIPTYEQWLRFAFPGGLVLNDGQTYFIRVDSTGPVTEKVYLGVDGSAPAGSDHLVNKDGVAEIGKRAAHRVLQTTATAGVPTATNLDAPETYLEDAPRDLNDIFVSDPDSAAVSVTLALSDPAAGTLSVGTAGGVTSTFAAGVWTASGPIADVNALLAGVSFMPAPDYDASFGIATTVTDGASIVTGNKPVTGTPANDPPVAAGDTYAVVEDAQLIVPASTGVLANDSDVDSATLTAQLFSSPGGGTLLFNGDGSFVYTPFPDFHGSDSFGYRVHDGATLSNLATVTINVTSVNDAPVVSASVPTPLPEGSDTSGGVVVATLNTTDVDGGSSTYSLDAGADASRFVLAGNQLLLRDGVLDFEVRPSYAVTVRSTDTGGLSGTVSVTVPVLDVNEPPAVALANVVGTLSESTSTATRTRVADVSVTDDALGSETLALTGADAALFELFGGALYLRAGVTLDFETRPSLAVSVAVDDSTLGGSPDVAVPFALAVTDANDAPVALSEQFAVVEGTPLDVAAAGVLANDTDVDSATLSAVLVAGPARGALTLHADGAFRYVPAPGFAGRDSFVYRASDGSAMSQDVVVQIDVTAVNDAPAATADVFDAVEDQPLAVVAAGVLANDLDADGDALTALLVSPPTHGTVALAGDGSFVYTPAADYAGDDAFTYRVTDGIAMSQSATVVLRVAPVNDAPVAVGDAYTLEEDVPLTVGAGGVLANDGDREGDRLAVSLLSPPRHGSLALAADGSFTYVPDPDFSGDDRFSYSVRDTAGGTAVAEVMLAVSAAAGTPVAPPRDLDELPAVIAPSPSDQVGVPGNDAKPARASAGPTVTSTGGAPTPAGVPPLVAAWGPDSADVLSAAPPVAAPELRGDTPASTEGRDLPPVGAAFAPVSAGARAARAPVSEVPPVPPAGAVAEAPSQAVAPVRSDAPVAPESRPVAGASASPPIQSSAAEVPSAGSFVSPTVHDGSGHPGDAAAAEAIRGGLLREQLDRARAASAESEQVQRFATGTVTVAGSALSVGYVLWLLRGGVLLSSLLSSLPAWRFIDPLPVLSRGGSPVDDDDEDDESLEDLVARDAPPARHDDASPARHHDAAPAPAAHPAREAHRDQERQ
jgi:hypothetical protein